MIEVRLLGSLEVLAGGRPIEITRPKQRTLLALLALRAGEVVSADALIEELWNGRPPATAKDALQNNVSQLRKILGHEAIETRPPGYVLAATAGRADVQRFEQLAAQARSTVDLEGRAAILRDALAVWRGPALDGVGDDGSLAVEAARLEEARVAVEEASVDAELELGRDAELLPRLEALVERRPYDERARAQLMLALYRAGRQAEALEVFRDARSTLADELGLEPSPTLRELERSILLQEPSLTETSSETPAAEQRKTVTVLSVELAPPSDLDPEQLQIELVDAIAAARAAVERHEGWVTTRAGDELLCVFGVPTAHEDDALRAVRAAVQLRDSIGPTGVRVGIETGQALTGHGFVTGDVTRVAGQLRSSAVPNEILVGSAALSLVRHAVAGRRSRRGFRLESVQEDAPAVAGYAEAPLTGRSRELDDLLGRFDAVRSEGRPHLVVLVGEAGIGKSRLAHELAARLRSSATVLTGRCVAYGEGATYLPLRTMLAGINLDHVLAAEPDHALVVRRAAELVGLAEGAVAVDEGLWAVRRLFAGLALDRPLVLLFEDLHWAEERLLGFLDQLTRAGNGPVLVLAMARPELLDRWRVAADDVLPIAPLATDEVRSLVGSLRAGVDSATLDRLVEIAGGNPLFAEQLVGYAEERGAQALSSVPPSLDALLAARLDELTPSGRSAAQRAALVGRDFSRAPLEALVSPASRATLSADLLELVRHGLVHPARASGAEELFRFHHALVRDVAYASLPKADRAELHEAYGDWLAEGPGAADEIVGYHLEQAYRARAELAPVDRRARQLAADAGARLGAAGARSWRRNDVSASVDLLVRAADLLPDGDPLRRELMLDLALALYARGETAGAEGLLGEVLAGAVAARDLRIELRSRIELAYVSLQHDPEGKADRLLELTQASVPTFEQFGDDRSLARAWLLSGTVQGGHFCRNAAWQDAAEQALVHYRRAGFPAATCLGQIAAAVYYGPTPVPQAIHRCRELLGSDDDGRAASANVMRYLGGLVAMAGDPGGGRTLVDDARATLADLGHVGAAGYCDFVTGDIAHDAGDLVGARQARAALCAYCEQSEDYGALSTAAADLAHTLVELGDIDEAERWTSVSESHAAADDIGAQFGWRAARARALARRGESSISAELAHEAQALAEQTDAVNKHAAVLVSLAEVSVAGGDPHAARDAAERAVELYEAKGNVLGASRAREVLATPLAR